jgi:hypothetical protein
LGYCYIYAICQARPRLSFHLSFFYRIISVKIVRSLDAGQLTGVPFVVFDFPVLSAMSLHPPWTTPAESARDQATDIEFAFVGKLRRSTGCSTLHRLYNTSGYPAESCTGTIV